MHRVERAQLGAPARVVDVNQLADLCAFIDVERFQSVYSIVRSATSIHSVSFWNVGQEDRIRIADIVPSEIEEGEDHAGDPDAEKISLTVVICTRDRPAELDRALDSLRLQTDVAFDIVIVDNAPSTTATRDVVMKSFGSSISYVLEERPGLSRARNRGLQEVTTTHVLYIDDDELADLHLVEEMKRGFLHPSAPSAVCGTMFPAELETAAQIRFEQFDGFNKGRGLKPRVIKLGGQGLRSPLFPLPGFGAGGNMAFAVSSLSEIGGFDECLGVGTPTGGGEETRALSALLRRGETVLHWPSAITWHFHRRDMQALLRQMKGYGAGLTAFYASTVFEDPKTLLEILSLVPTGIHELRRTSDSVSSEPLPEDFPNELIRASRRGLLLGGVYYSQEYFRHIYRSVRTR